MNTILDDTANPACSPAAARVEVRLAGIVATGL